MRSALAGYGYGTGASGATVLHLENPGAGRELPVPRLGKKKPFVHAQLSSSRANEGMRDLGANGLRKLNHRQMPLDWGHRHSALLDQCQSISFIAAGELTEAPMLGREQPPEPVARTIWVSAKCRSLVAH